MSYKDNDRVFDYEDSVRNTVRRPQEAAGPAGRARTTDDESRYAGRQISRRTRGGVQSEPREASEDENYSEAAEEQGDTHLDMDSILGVKIVDSTVYAALLRKKSAFELQQIADAFSIDNFVSMSKQVLLFTILRKIASCGYSIIVEGLAEVVNEGFAFIRSEVFNYLGGADDVYISPNQVRRFGIKTGDQVGGEARLAKKNERCFALYRLISINGFNVNEMRRRICFDDLVPCYPEEKLALDCHLDGVGTNADLSTRIMDIISPLGKGQRALIVAPPKTGKTMLMQNIAHAIATNHPEITLIVLLIDERPEEVTDMIRSAKGLVLSSTFDEPPQRHVNLAELALEKAKRIVESSTEADKKHVVILLDSITRLARAYNAVVPPSGKVLTGGVDANALQRPKRFFGAARNIVGGGSLTIIATALIDTGSRMDEVIFEEFKGTGNSEIILDRRIADKRMFPAMDIIRSGTRKEELLLTKERLQKVWILRRILSQMGATDAMEFLLTKIAGTKNNDEFFNSMMNQ